MISPSIGYSNQRYIRKIPAFGRIRDSNSLICGLPLTFPILLFRHIHGPHSAKEPYFFLLTPRADLGEMMYLQGLEPWSTGYPWTQLLYRLSYRYYKWAELWLPCRAPICGFHYTATRFLLLPKTEF